MKEPEDIARFVDFVDKNIFANSEFWKLSVAERQEFHTEIAERTKNHISDIKDSNQMTNITLRLWASCLSAERRCENVCYCQFWRRSGRRTLYSSNASRHF